MAVDLNKLREKLRDRRPMGVDRDGRITTENPRNDGSREDAKGHTTLEPKRFFE